MMKFQLGQMVATPGALDALAGAGQNWVEFVNRHARGDWGELDEDDKQTNEEAIRFGDRILSAYKLKDGEKIWIITEADRSATTVLLPDEY